MLTFFTTVYYLVRILSLSIAASAGALFSCHHPYDIFLLQEKSCRTRLVDQTPYLVVLELLLRSTTSMIQNQYHLRFCYHIITLGITSTLVQLETILSEFYFYI